MLCDPDEMIDCPYCDPPKNHQLRYKRLNVHLVDLRKSDPTIGRDKVPCPFNAKHYIEKALKQDHMLHCPDRDVVVRSVLHEQEIASKQYEYRYESVSVLNHDHVTKDEYWEADLRNEFACNLRFKEERPSVSSQPSEDSLRQPKTAPRVLTSNSTSSINSSESGSSVNQDPPRPRLAGYGRGVPKSSAIAESRQATVTAPGVIASNNVPKTATATRGFKLNPGPAKAQTKQVAPTPQGSVKSGGSAGTMGAAPRSNGPAAPLGNVPSVDSNQIPANLRSSPSVMDDYLPRKKEYNSLWSFTKSVPSEDIASQNPADIRLSAPNASEWNSGGTYPTAPRQPAPSEWNSGGTYPTAPRQPAPSEWNSGGTYPTAPRQPAPSEWNSGGTYPTAPRQPAPSEWNSGSTYPTAPRQPAPSEWNSGGTYPTAPRQPAPSEWNSGSTYPTAPRQPAPSEWNSGSTYPTAPRQPAPSEWNSGSTYPTAPRQPAPSVGTFNPIRHTTCTRFPLFGNSNEPGKSATGSTVIRWVTPAVAGLYRESSSTASRASVASNLMRPSDFTRHDPSVPQTSSMGGRSQLGSARIRGASSFSSNQPRISTPGLRMVTHALGMQPLKTDQSQDNDSNSGSQNEGSSEVDSSTYRARQKKKLEKKLIQIEKLEQLQRPLNNEEAQKVASKSEVLKELAQL